MLKRATSVANDFYSQFGRLVRNHRCRNRLTQQELSKRLKMSRASVANIELGRQKILLHQWFALADALEADPADLLPFSRRKEEGDIQIDLAVKLKADHYSASEIDWVKRILNSAEIGTGSEKKAS